jgi:hypothetical protein
MSQQTHTPGPWTVIEHSWSDTSVCSAADGMQPVASLSIESRADEDTQDHWEAVMAANARLIASAPELLEALQRIVQPLEWTDGKTIEFDGTMLFGLGYDFEGLELMAEEAETELGRFVIWPDRFGGSKNWAFYGGTMGLFQQGFATCDAAKAEVFAMHQRAIANVAIAKATGG